MADVQVAVIGGGPLGLMALKNFKDDGFDVTLYETRGWVGGLWKYSEDDGISTAENTTFNSSKYRTGISDFPVPDDMDDFPTAPQLHKYLESYCSHFDLWPHIKLHSRTESVKRVGKRWAVEIRSNDGTFRTEHFDKVAFACGTFISPRKPDLQGIEHFGGQALHAVNYHNPSQFKGKNVVIVGVHASAQDVVASLSKYAAHAYLSHRSGVVMVPRYGKDGSVYDRMPPLNFIITTAYISQWFPSLFNWIIDKLLAMLSKQGFPNPPASLGTLATTKAPSVAVSPPLIATAIYPHFQSGFCSGVPEVKRILSAKQIELKDGTILNDIDTIIYCTGYDSVIPVNLDPQELNPYPYPGAPPTLYRNIFPLHPDPDIRNSLAFLGQGAIPLAGFMPHEMISVAVSQIWRGNSTLPPLGEMQKWNRDYLQWRRDLARKYHAGTTFYTAFMPMTDHMVWVDSCAGLGIRRHFGLLSRWTSREAWAFWWRERRLYNLCLTGLASPAIFRLFGEGKRKAWEGARAQIWIDNERVQRQQEERRKALEKEL